MVNHTNTILVFIAFERSRRGNVSIVCFSHDRKLGINEHEQLTQRKSKRLTEHLVAIFCSSLLF